MHVCVAHGHEHSGKALPLEPGAFGPTLFAPLGENGGGLHKNAPYQLLAPNRNRNSARCGVGRVLVVEGGAGGLDGPCGWSAVCSREAAVMPAHPSGFSGCSTLHPSGVLCSPMSGQAAVLAAHWLLMHAGPCRGIHCHLAVPCGTQTCNETNSHNWLFLVVLLAHGHDQQQSCDVGCDAA